MKKDIIISHPGVQHSYMVALAIQEMCRLEKFITSFFYKNTKFPYHVLSKIRMIDNLFKKRCFDLLNQDNICNIPYYEICEQVCRVLLGNSNITNKFIYWRDRAFDQHVSLFQIGNGAKLFIGYPNASYNSFKKVKRWGGQCILDLPIGYYKEAESILEEEKQLHPDFADSITYSNFDEIYKRRVDQELAIADRIVIPSQFVNNTLTKHGFNENKLKVIPYGSYFEPIDQSFIKESRPDQPIRIIYAGQLSQRKGIKYLLDAAKELKKMDIRFELTLVGKIYGSGSALKSYEGLYRYVPFLERDKLKNLLCNSDIFVFPSLFEGSGLVILEALSNGLPVITTTNSGADAIIENENGFIVPIRDAQKIVEKILLLYNNRTLLNRMKVNSIKSSYIYSWNNYRTKWQDFIIDEF